MEQETHRLVTRKALELLAGFNSSNSLLSKAQAIENSAFNADDQRDIEFVDVEGIPTADGGRDDPHRDELFVVNDRYYKVEPITGMKLTGFNHYIDIRKGAGEFDDYDGYSYNKGSASREQHQKISELSATSKFKAVLQTQTSKVDEGINWWLNDEYVHVQGHPWYRGCSPAMERYSFPQDKGRFPSIQHELVSRFPLAKSVGTAGAGIPFSVFMPVDNLARYHDNLYQSHRDPVDLGFVLHAIQDASIPHHAAGCHGNWHDKYELDLIAKIPAWLADAQFISEVRQLFTSWYTADSNTPGKLGLDDYQLKPSKTWRIDFLVTWVALNAYHTYAQEYNSFITYSDGSPFNSDSQRELTKIALAMSLLYLSRVSGVSLPVDQALITISETSHDFGTENPVPFTFTFHSTGNLPVHVTQITPPATQFFRICKLIPMVPATLKPNTMLRITVEYLPPADRSHPRPGARVFPPQPASSEVVIPPGTTTPSLPTDHLRPIDPSEIIFGKPADLHQDKIVFETDAVNHRQITLSLVGGFHGTPGIHPEDRLYIELENLKEKLNWPTISVTERTAISSRIRKLEKELEHR